MTFTHHLYEEHRWHVVPMSCNALGMSCNALGDRVLSGLREDPGASFDGRPRGLKNAEGVVVPMKGTTSPRQELSSDGLAGANPSAF